ncbi:MAG TPA: hypothetical protein VF540_00430 [Segetibacter sp.]
MRNGVCTIVLFSIMLVLPSCINLKSVQDYTKVSITSISQFEELSYTFNKHCRDKCLMQSVSRNTIAREIDCNCEIYNRADSVTVVIYNALRAYFGALGDLANNEVTNYNFTPVQKALSEASIPLNGKTIEITGEQVTSYTKIASLLLKATTNGYRNKKIKNFIVEGNEPVKILAAAFQQILSQHLAGELNFKKERLYKFYNEIVLDESSSVFEKRKATAEYYEQAEEVNSKQRQIGALSESLKKVSEGHERLAKSKLSPNELRELLAPVSTDIRALVSEFNKFKKSEQ